MRQKRQAKTTNIIAAAALAVTLTPTSAVITWDRNTESDLLGYKVYVGTQSRVYDAVFPTSDTTLTIPRAALPAGVEFFVAVSALDSSLNESELSTEVTFRLERRRLNAPADVTVEVIR